jgi:Phage capsid family
MVTPTDPLFAGYPVSPKRISGLINISSQLLKQQTSPELDRILISDVSRQLPSYLDQVALYGTGPSGNQPLGLTGVPGVNQAFPIDSADLHGSFCALEAQIEAANVDMTNYGVLVSPASKKTLRTTPSFTGGSITTWVELTNPQSSPEITDGKCFAGAWNNMTFCFFGRGVEVLVDPFSLSQSNQVRLMSSLFCDVGIRYPNAFAVTAAVT